MTGELPSKGMGVRFIVPTLNRAGTVVRAVDSCLAAMDRAGWPGTVSVLDSESDDGSWEALQKSFGSDDRVLLRQNKRGLGPTRSWLDGAEGVRSEAATFVWSDDYIAPDFLIRLGSAVRDGAAVAIGVGLPRPVDCAYALPDAGDDIHVTAQALLDRYCTGSPLEEWESPVTPVCALFRDDVFELWRHEVERLSSMTALRRDVMWRRAIGPDLLLFLIALSRDPDDRVYLTKAAVAQLSMHPDSITISSSTWDLSLGYWLANVAFLTDPISRPAVSDARRARYSGALLVRGAWLWLRAPRQAVNDGQQSRRAMIAAEIISLLRATKGGRMVQSAAALSFLRTAVARRMGGQSR